MINCYTYILLFIYLLYRISSITPKLCNYITFYFRLVLYIKINFTYFWYINYEIKKIIVNNYI